MVAMMIISLLFVLGVGMLYAVERDGQANLSLQRTQKALVLARSGISFARYAELGYGPGAVGSTHRIYNVDSAGHEQFEIWKDADTFKTVHAVGLVKDSRGVIFARRELAAPTVDATGYTIATSMNVNIWDVDL